LKCGPYRGLFVRGVLQFDHGQRKAVDKQHDVRPPCPVSFLDRELVDGQKLVVARLVEIN